MFDRKDFDSKLRTKDLGRSFTFLDSCPSTNSIATLLAQSGAPNGAIVITDFQSAGRGRSNSRWVAFPGRGLTFSLILRDYPGDLVPLFSLVTGLGVVEALKKELPDTKLKWPNDILIEGRKTGGILCESRWEGANAAYTVIGIGLNVNERHSVFPSEIRKEVTSLSIRAGHMFNRETLLANLLNRLDVIYHALQSGEKEAILSRWSDLCFHLDKEVEIRSAKTSVKGKFLGVDLRGHARIDTKEGEKSIADGSLFYL